MNQPTVTHEKAAAGARWRSAFGPDEVIQRVRPKEDKGYIPNPHRGTTTFQRFNGDPLYPDMTWDDTKGPDEFPPFGGNIQNARYPATTLSYCRWVWSQLELKKGKFRWEIVDGALAAARARGQTVQARVQPYVHNDMPRWYWELGGKALPAPAPVALNPDDPFAQYVDRGGQPDHNHPAYLKHFGEMIRAFGKRYDGHPDLESFDVAYGGGCGEGGGNCTHATARKLVDIYVRSFKRTQLLSMLGTDGCKHVAKNENIGWRTDCYGDVHTEGLGAVPDGLNWNQMYDSYPRTVFECGLTERWKTAPITLETCWTVPYWAQRGWDVDWIVEQGLKYHATVFMPKSCYIPDGWRDKIDAFDRRLGYRFVLRQCDLPLQSKPGAKIAYHIWIENIGVATLYRDYVLAFRFRQGKTQAIVPLKTKLRTWLPGDVILLGSAAFPKSLQRGEVDVDIGILDEKIKAAKVLFAIQPRLEDRWHPLTKMDVV